MDYSTWKVKKSVINYVGLDEEKQSAAEQARQEYSEAAKWCEEDEHHNIVETRYYYEVQEKSTVIPDEQITVLRASAYAAEVDCITAHIQRLRDMEQTPEIEAEIAELMTERDAKVEEIKQRYPYSGD